MRPAFRLALPLALSATVVVGAAGASDLALRGVLDVTATSARDEAFYANLLTRGDNPFDPYGLRLFVDGSVNPRLAVLAQLVFHESSGPYVDGAYAMWTPHPERDFHVLAGKVPWLIGTFAPRTYSDRNPLIGKPLMYQHHTTLVWYAAPPGADALLASAGTGQDGIPYLDGASRGMAVVDDSWWDTGVMASGSLTGVEYSLGFTTGTPGWGNGGEDDNRGKTTLGRLGVSPAPWLRVGASGAWGPYLVHDLGAPLPAGRRPEDYHQRLMMGDAELLRGHGELRAEGFSNVWETPTVGDLPVRGGYVEGKLTLRAGMWAAARWDLMRFGELRDSTGAARPWDDDLDRIESGLGLRWNRDVLLKGVYQRTFQHRATVEHRADLVALQLTVLF